MIPQARWTVRPTLNAPLLQQVRHVLNEHKESIDREIKARAEPALNPPDRPNLADSVNKKAATVATDGSVKNGTAGGALAIFNGAHDTRPSPTDPNQSMQFRVYGTQSSNRAELYAVLRALRLCKPIKQLHILCDSETSKKMIFKALSGKHIKHNTPNRDLITRCATEMQWRHDQPEYKTEWVDVKAHSDEEPWEHKKADLLAGKATQMALPPHNAHLRELEPAWALLYKGTPCQDEGLKTILRTLENEAATAGGTVPSNLRPSLLSKHKHTGESQAISCKNTVNHAVQEILFRLKFGAVRGTPRPKPRGTNGEGDWHICPRCDIPIWGANRREKLHGHHWVDHCLHHCAYHALVSARQKVLEALSGRLKECMSRPGTAASRPDGRPRIAQATVEARSLTDFSDLVIGNTTLGHPPGGELPKGGLVIDLRGYVPQDIRQRMKDLGITSLDITSMLNVAKRPLQAITKLIDKQVK